LKPKKKPLKSLKSLKKDAWKQFSIWIRQSNADWKGYVQCFTCSFSYVWNSGEIHAGHFIHDKLDFDPINIHPQCEQCNYWKKGNTRVYAIKMVEKYGLEAVQDLERRAAQKGNRYNRLEINEIIEHYKNLNEGLS
jgi:hypothetical protein